MATEPLASGSAIPGWRTARWWGRLALTYAIAVAAGYAASVLSMPLPWMLGPFFLFAALSVAGLGFALIPHGRELGQVAIGVAVGLRFTPAVLGATLVLMPAMLVATVYVILYTMAAAFLFRPLGKVDPVTGFFATAAGGMADMAMVAERFGGSSGPVAVVHAMRVAAVVALVPFLVVAFGEAGTAPDPVPLSTGDLMLVPLVLAIGYLGARLLKPTPLPNPWLVGPIFAGMAIGAADLFAVRVPWAVIVVAQVVLGTWLGCQFRRDLLAALPRVTASAVVVALFMIGCAAAGALVLAAATGLPYTTSFLALAPAAVTEMVLTAQVMHLEAEIVTAFHVMRIAIVSSTVLVVFRIYERLRGGRS